MGDVPECFKNGLPRTTYEGPPNLTPTDPNNVPEYTAKEFFAHLRPAVRAFALKMEEKLCKNDHKADWKGCTIDCLRSLLDGEPRELDAALQNESGQAIAYEAADLANYAMMISDVAGGLMSVPQGEGKPEVHYTIGARRS